MTYLHNLQNSSHFIFTTTTCQSLVTFQQRTNAHDQQFFYSQKKKETGFLAHKFSSFWYIHIVHMVQETPGKSHLSTDWAR